MKKTGLAAVAALGVLVAGPLAAAEYYCQFDGRSSRSLVPPDLILTVDTATGKAQVIDGTIQSRFGKPLDASVIDSNATRVLVAWQVPGARNSVGQFTHAFRYRLNLLPGQGSGQITAAVEGYSNHESLKGKCTRRK